MKELPQVSDALLAKYNLPGPRYTSYPTVPNWTPEFSEARYTQALQETDPEKPLAIYIHIPFCWSMCTFCGCNVVISKDRDRGDLYLDDLAREMDLVVPHLGKKRTVEAVHLGGGTPTFLSIAQLERLWALINAHFTLEKGAEISLEINPTVTSMDQLKALAKMGFNRLSMGVQDLDPEVQAAIHRSQNFADTQRYIDSARDLGFGSVNVDLIYGLPRQTTASWGRTLDQLLLLKPDRLAVYSFAYLPDLRPAQRKLVAEDLPRGRAKLDLLRQAYGTLVGAGYAAIGMDHFAAETDSLAHAAKVGKLWRNFQGYTIQHHVDTVAFGSSGISDISGIYAQNIRPLGQYRRAAEAGHIPLARGIALTEDDMERRDIINALMCNLQADLGANGKVRYASELAALTDLEADGLIHLEGTVIQVTEMGRIFLRNVAMPFDTWLARHQGGAPRFSSTV